MENWGFKGGGGPKGLRKQIIKKMIKNIRNLQNSGKIQDNFFPIFFRYLKWQIQHWET